MKGLYLTTAVIEMGTGLALLTAPSVVVELLLGVPLDSVASTTLGRVTGAALIALGLTCWLPRGRQPAQGLIPTFLFYNIVVAGLLAFAGCSNHLTGMALWPAVGLHAGMAVWWLTGSKQGPTEQLTK